MIALAIRQPFAFLIAEGFKEVENRSRRTNYRVPVLIHASKSPAMSAEALERVLVTRRGGVSAGELIRTLDRYYEVAKSGGSTIRTGGIIGRVDIVDCVRDYDSPWAIPGQWHWVLANPVILPFQPCKGQLNFFTPEV